MKIFMLIISFIMTILFGILTIKNNQYDYLSLTIVYCVITVVMAISILAPNKYL